MFIIIMLIAGALAIWLLLHDAKYDRHEKIDNQGDTGNNSLPQVTGITNIPTPEELGGLLFSIHAHVYDQDGAEVPGVYYHEDDIIKLLVKLGFPEPVWGKCIKIDEYNLSNKSKVSPQCGSSNQSM